MLLYPHLAIPEALSLSKRFAKMSITDLRHESALSHPSVTYTPTGGNQVSAEHLKLIREKIRDAAFACGYPEPFMESAKRRFDSLSASILYDEMDVSPSEASNLDIWTFMACILLPDVVRWRFPGGENGTSEERFLKPKVRNTFARVWWRAYTLKSLDGNDPYIYLNQMGEDELVQIMERSRIASSPFLARNICQSFLKVLEKNPGISRSDLLRDVMKRLRRLLTVVSFDALDEDIVSDLVSEEFELSIRLLQGNFEPVH